MTTSADPETTRPLLDSMPLLGEPHALRARADEDGVLFFSGLLDRSRVLALREQIVGVLRQAGWVRPDSPSDELVVDAERYQATVGTAEAFDGGSGPVYAEVQRLEAFHGLAHDPALLRVYELLLQGPVMPHPRNIARFQVPVKANVPTPPHQDFIHIQGTTDVWTAWIPLGDCPVELGGLTVLAGSHRAGVLDYRESPGVGTLEAYICGLNLTWMQGEYRAGDVITFHSHTIHRALPNQTDRIRLSADYRYQRSDDLITAGSLEPHGQVLSWEEIYQGWRDESLKYYWRQAPLELSEFDPIVRWQKDHIC